MNLSGEAEYVVKRAQEGHGCVVTLGPLLLFSTHSGDAWLLEPEGGLALCLARNGERLPVTILDTPTTFSIEWTASYRIHRDEFTVQERAGRGRCILGYPTDEIHKAIRRISKP